MPPERMAVATSCMRESDVARDRRPVIFSGLTSRRARASGEECAYLAGTVMSKGILCVAAARSKNSQAIFCMQRILGF